MFEKIVRQALLLAEPVGFVWAMLIVLGFLLLRIRQRKLAAVALFLSALLFVFGSTGFPGWLLGGLERPYAGLHLEELPPADAIVVLGGGAEPVRYEAPGFRLTRAGDRLLMGLAALRLGKSSVLVLGGGGADFDGGFRAEADAVQQWLAAWDLPRLVSGRDVEVVSLGHCADTHDESVKVGALAARRGWRRVLLVTSASHMRRASALFRMQRLDIAPAPCNFLTNVSTAPPPPGLTIPGYGGLEKFSIWLHEEVGWWEYRRRGWIR